MASTDLVIGIGANYTGKPAFNKASKDVFGLQRGVKSLAKAYIGLAGAQKAYAYGKASLNAFVADDKAARQLSKTVGNLGLAYEATNVENFVQGLEKTYHVADDLLRPAFAKLIQVTGSYTKSKELLTTALNASAGAGVDLSQTVQDLSQAYVGNLKGLKKYNLGLTNAELATMSFQQIQDKLNSTFAGQAALSASTYAGQMDALTIASKNAKETIGKGLIDALTAAGGHKGDIAGLVTEMDKLAHYTNNALGGIGSLIGGFIKLVKLTDKITPGYQVEQAKKAKAGKAPYDPMNSRTPGLSSQDIKLIQARAKADALAAKRQKELAALVVKQTKAIKEQTALQKLKALLEKASNVMNMDLIQNVAALQGKLTEDETLRLKFQQAVLLGNADAAAQLGQQLLSVQLAAVMSSTIDPFGNWSKSALAAMDAIKAMQDELAKLGSAKILTPQQLLAQDYVAVLKDAQDMSYTMANQDTQAVLDMFKNLSNVPSNPTSAYTPSTGNFTYGQGNPLNVQVFVDPSAMSYGINAAVVGNTANGNQNSLSRTGNGW
jgi:hypothetical protein